MTHPMTYPSTPVELPLKIDANPPRVADCDVCAALDRERSEARAMGNGSKVTDCNVEIRSHPHKGRRS